MPRGQQRTKAIGDHRPWWVIIKDNDAREFNIEGPIRPSDDREWTYAVCRVQESGKHVTCTTARGSHHEVEAAFCALGFRLTDRAIVVR